LIALLDSIDARDFIVAGLVLFTLAVVVGEMLKEKTS
jgi:hypothetical protein